MAHKKTIKKKRQRLLVLYIIFLAVFAGIIYTLPNYIGQVLKKYDEKNQLEENLVTLTNEQAELEKEVIQLGDSSYVAKIARQKYLFSKSGELIIKIIDDKTNEQITTEPEEKKTFEIILAIVLASITLYFIINKKVKTRHK